MRIAFSTIACPFYGPEQMAEAARAHGYDGVELYAAWGRTLTPDLLAAELARVRRALRGVPIVCLNSFATLGQPDPVERAASEATLALAIELAAELECPLVKAFGGDVPDGVSREEVAATGAELLARASARAGTPRRRLRRRDARRLLPRTRSRRPAGARATRRDRRPLGRPPPRAHG